MVWRLQHAANQVVSADHSDLCRNASEWTGKVRCFPDRLDLPLHWKKPRRIFVDSMSDLFHPEVPDEFILRVFDTIRKCKTERPGHVFLVLTKRPERMRDFCAWLRFDGYQEMGAPTLAERADSKGYWLMQGLTNLWLGVSIENQETADERIAILLDTPAAHRFVSAEPLLGPVDLQYAAFNGADSLQKMAGLDWVIVGGESGPRARPCDLEWIRSIVRQCRAAVVPIFTKQLGSYVQREEMKCPEK
jgi:protein gp37